MIFIVIVVLIGLRIRGRRISYCHCTSVIVKDNVIVAVSTIVNNGISIRIQS